MSTTSRRRPTSASARLTALALAADPMPLGRPARHTRARTGADPSHFSVAGFNPMKSAFSAGD